MTLLLYVPCESGKNELKPVPNPPQKEETTKKIAVDASDYTKRIYINFNKGKAISVSTPKTDLSWDLGLHRYDLKTNGDTSGKDKGVATCTSQRDLMADIPTPKDSERVLDREEILLMKFDMGKHGMKYEKQSVNFLFTSEPKDDGRGCLNKGTISRVDTPPMMTVDSPVFPVHSATGQIARVRVLDYRNVMKKTGHIILEYTIKTDKK